MSSRMGILRRAQRASAYLAPHSTGWPGVLTLVILLAGNGLLVGLGGAANAQEPVFVDRAASVGLIDAHGHEGPLALFGSALADSFYVTHGSGGAVYDIDRDGDLDIIIAGYAGEADRIWLNQLADNGTLTFSVEVLPGSAIPWRRSVAVADYNRDGDLDILLHGDGFGDAPGTILLLRDDPSGWRELTLAPHINEIAQTFVVAADFGSDGLPWLLTGAWAYELPGAGDVRYGRLRLFQCGQPEPEVCTEHPIMRSPDDEALRGNYYAAAFADLLGAENPPTNEVFVANDYAENPVFAGEPGQWQNVAAGSALDVDGANMGVAVADFDDDGDLDLYTTEIVNQSAGIATEYASRFFVRNDGSDTYTDEAALLGVVSTDWGWSAYFADLNHDSRLDLVVANGAESFTSGIALASHPVGLTPNIIFLQQESGSYARLVNQAIDVENETRALIPADLDRDGDLDLVELNYRGPFRVLMNESEDLPPSLHLLLEPPMLARGATLEVHLDGRTLRRDLIAGEGYLSQRPDELHVAVPEEDFASASFVLRWRNGHETELLGLPSEGIYRLLYPHCASESCEAGPAWSCELMAEDRSRCELVAPSLSWTEQFIVDDESTGPPDGDDGEVDASSSEVSIGSNGCQSTSGQMGVRWLAAASFTLLCAMRRRRGSYEEVGT